MTDTGIGSTTVVSRHNQVCNHRSLQHYKKANLICWIALYRSKEAALPDFSKENNEVGEIFVDVSTFTKSEKTFLIFSF